MVNYWLGHGKLKLMLASVEIRHVPWDAKVSFNLPFLGFQFTVQYRYNPDLQVGFAESTAGGLPRSASRFVTVFPSDSLDQKSTRMPASIDPGQSASVCNLSISLVFYLARQATPTRKIFSENNICLLNLDKLICLVSFH